MTYFAGTFVRHPLALAAARASLLHLKKGGREFYTTLNDRTQRMIERLNRAFAVRGAPVKAVHCASLWRLQWDDNQKYISLFYYLVRYHGLHLYEQFGHFVTEGMRQPCHLKFKDGFALVPDLASVVTILDKNNKPVAHLCDGNPTDLRSAPREKFIPGKFVHPHTAIWLGKRDILVAEWVPIGRITRLRRLD